MKQHLLGLIVSLAVSGPLCLGQTTQPLAEDWKPSTTNRPGQQYPRNSVNIVASLPRWIYANTIMAGGSIFGSAG